MNKNHKIHQKIIKINIIKNQSNHFSLKIHYFNLKKKSLKNNVKQNNLKICRFYKKLQSRVTKLNFLRKHRRASRKSSLK